MSTTSKKYFPEKIKKLVWDEFLGEVRKIKTQEDLSKLLDKYFTDNEKIILEKRLVILFLLRNGKGFRETSREADVALNTVGFIKKGFKVKRKIKEEMSNKRKKFIVASTERVTKYPKYPTYRGRGRWRFLNTY